MTVFDNVLYPAKDFAYGTILTAPSPATTGTSFVLNSGQGALFNAPATEGSFRVWIWPAGVNPTATNAEEVEVTAISTDTFTITRHVGGIVRTVVVGDQVAINLGMSYYNKIMRALADGVVEDVLLPGASFTRSSDTQFVTPGDKTLWYTAGRVLRINNAGAYSNHTVVSSSYGAPNTTVTVKGTALPAALTNIYIGIQPKGGTDFIANNKAAGSDVTTGTNDLLLVTPKAIKDAGIVVTPVKASASELDTGTDDAKFATALAIAGRAEIGGWTPARETWTYASASTITVPSGAASRYAVGDRIKWTQTTVKYGVIVAVADTVLTIMVNTDYVVTNAAISANFYSHQASPIGYPHWFALATPTWNTGNYDNGSGGQPTTTEYRGKVDGKMFTGHIRATGVKAGANNYWDFDLGTLPTPVNTSVGTAIGAALASWAAFTPGILNWYGGTTLFVMVSASIPDNSTGLITGSVFSYEI